MAPSTTPAQKLRRVNIAMLAVLVPGMLVCLVLGLWVPAFVFGFLSFTNGYQLYFSKRASNPHDDR